MRRIVFAQSRQTLGRDKHHFQLLHDADYQLHELCGIDMSAGYYADSAVQYTLLSCTGSTHKRELLDHRTLLLTLTAVEQ